MTLQAEVRIPPFHYTMLDAATIGIHWEKWKRSFEIYTIAEAIEDPSRKKALLLHLAGQEVQDIFFSIPDADTVSENENAYDKTVTALDSYFLPKRNISYERHLFRSLKQEPKESINNFVTRLRQQGKYCNYANLDEEIRDQIIEKCTSNELRKKSLEKGDVTLDGIIKLAQTLELSTHQMETLKNEEIQAVRSRNFQKKEKPRNYKSDNFTCYRCGNKGHLSKDAKCPARNKKCKNCNLEGHFWKMCKTKTERVKSKQNFKRTYQVEEDTTYSRGNEDVLFGIINQVSEDLLFTFEIGNIPVKMMVDSGASCNVINKKTWDYLKRNKVKGQLNSSWNKKLYAYGSHTSLKVLGKFTSEVKIANRKTVTDFYVVEEGKVCLLGKETSERLGILKIGLNVNTIKAEELLFKKKCFQEIGKLKNYQLKLSIDETVSPIAQPYRRIPLLWQKKVENKLEELLNSDIIEKVEGPTTWVSPIVVIPKENGEIRLCVDMRLANTAIKRHIHPLPTIDDILPDLGKSKFFSKLDISSAFHQVELSPESRTITTFITHKGLFRYKRLMFGLNCAPENFQRIVEQLLRDCEGCRCFIDDIIIFAETLEEHNRRLDKVLVTLEEAGLSLQKSKCLIGVSEIDYLGHKLTSQGIKPSEKKVEAILKFRRPRDKDEVKSFLGLVNFVGRYIPNLASLNEPLRNLTKACAKFQWTKKENNSFLDLKKALTSDTILGYFNPEEKTQVIADASPVGLGAVLLQEGRSGPKVICYASKSLSLTEKRYSQTEKEALALIWACEKFKMYLLGKEFDLITDHKPLEVIFGKRSKPCARIERWVLRLQSFKYKIIHIPGKKNIADPLSRLCYNENNDETFDKDEENYVNSILQDTVPRAMTEEEIIHETNVDLESGKIKDALKTNNWTEVAHQYKIVCNELSCIQGIIFRGTRIVIPKSLRNRVLEIAHEGHPGIVKMKQLVRTKVWWPQIDKDVEKKVKTCHGCQLVTITHMVEPLKKRQFPSEPWKELALDFMGPLPSGDHLLVVIDYYSKYFEVEIMKNITATETIKRLKTMFARFGYPISITMDNATQFTSQEMKEFCETSGIKLVHTTPYWPQANGEVERQNRTLLKRLRIAQAEKKDWKEELLKFLFMYRTTEHTTTEVSPAELMFGRKLRGKLPSFSESTYNKEEMRERIAHKAEVEKNYADRRRKARENNIEQGTKVLVKQTRKNKLSTYYNPEPHIVINKQGNSFTLKSPQGTVFKRNGSHIKPFEEEKKLETETEEDATTSINDTEIENATEEDNTTTLPRGMEETQILKTPNANENEESQKQEIKTRPSRNRRLPSYFKDFVTT